MQETAFRHFFQGVKEMTERNRLGVTDFVSEHLKTIILVAAFLLGWYSKWILLEDHSQRMEPRVVALENQVIAIQKDAAVKAARDENTNKQLEELRMDVKEIKRAILEADPPSFIYKNGRIKKF